MIPVRFFGLAVLLPAVAVLMALPASAAPFVCPASITVSESAPAVPGFVVSSPTLIHHFRGIAVVNSEIGNEEATLHPDKERRKGRHITQFWRLSDYRDRPLHILCQYIHTNVTLSADLAAELTTCEATYVFDEKIGTIDDPDDPARMICK